MRQYLLGLATVPALLAAAVAVHRALDNGLTMECAVCGFCTADFDAPRIVVHAQWQWHQRVVWRTREHRALDAAFEAAQAGAS